MGSPKTITIDGSAGEGGGQILRTALSLSLVTGSPFRIERIRAARKKPGLLRQHLTAVGAAAELGQATVEGAALGSGSLSFVPRKVRPGEYRFVVGTAGSTTLVFQTVLPALMIADGPSRLTLEGGTHNPWAPPFDFLDRAFLPIIRRMGPKVEATLRRHGFYPAGGGQFTVSLEPAAALRPIDLLDRGKLVSCSGRAVVSRLPLAIARREIKTIQDRLGLADDCVAAETVDSLGPGNCVTIEIRGEQITELFAGFGQKGVPAEKVAAGVAAEARQYLAAGVPVGQHLADQLLIPMVLAGGGSFRTLAPSNHTKTNLEVLRQFLDVEIRTEQLSPEVWQITLDAEHNPKGVPK
jgi:RNA 3'-terminal phosphate cyclase (ATP)